MLKQFIVTAAVTCAVWPAMHAQAGTSAPLSIVTPDVVETSRGTLIFKDGVPTEATAQELYDHLDFTYAYRAFMDTLRGVSIRALRRGMEDMGVKKNEVMVFSDLMDAKSLFLTPKRGHDLRHGLARP